MSKRTPVAESHPHRSVSHKSVLSTTKTSAERHPRLRRSADRYHLNLEPKLKPNTGVRAGQWDLNLIIT